jgi:hypothetical protein
MQAIRTQYKGPTDHKGSRIVAASYAGRTTTAYDHELSAEDNHRRAAELHAAVRWDTDNDPSRVYQLVHGTLPDGSHAHVLTGWF